MEIIKTIFGILIPFFGTVLGSAVVFAFRKNINTKTQSIFLAFSSGVMIAASIWSLIIPAIDMYPGNFGWIIVSFGVLIGSLFITFTDYFSKTNINNSKTKKLSFAIILHNIPEGMAVGIVFASSLKENFGVEFMSALMLSIGIAIQNIPEGMAIALPCKSEGVPNKKSFLLGVLSRNCRANCSFGNTSN